MSDQKCPEKRPKTLIDLCCGAGSWSRPFLERGWYCVGYDIRKFRPKRLRYPGQLVIQDIRTVTGFGWVGIVNLIVASPPCAEFSRARLKPVDEPDLSLVEACQRIAREARAPLVLENVYGLERFLGPPTARYGPFSLWGDGVPFMLPQTRRRIVKMRHRSPLLRSQIPVELAASVARFHSQ